MVLNMMLDVVLNLVYTRVYYPSSPLLDLIDPPLPLLEKNIPCGLDILLP